MDSKKNIVISGGTSGIGLATARILVAQGHNVILLGRSVEKGEKAVDTLAAYAGQVRFIAADVCDESACQRALAQGEIYFGAVHGLVTAAGQYEEKLLQYETLAAIKKLFAVNVYGTMTLCRLIQPYLRRSAGGSIVTVSSDAGLQGNVACSVYGATKGAIVAFTKSYALEAAPYGIRVNCVCPGDVQTPLLREQLQRNPKLTMSELREHYPLYRIAEPAEVGEVIAFLLSEKASFMTGTAVPVDGGLTSW